VTGLRILATSDLGAATLPLRTSTGESGTCAGVVSLLEREQERGPAVWLDVGDLVVGHPSYPLLGERPWADVAGLPIAAASPGNHDFDDGVEALRSAAATLSFPLLCANVEAGLPPTALVDTRAGPLGVIGLTHPQVDRLSAAPAPVEGWEQRVGELARDLRDDGARWVVALLHEGVAWWPADGPDGRVATRAARPEAVARPWAPHVDLILAGHDFCAWTGGLAGTPAGEPHLWASSVVVADLGDEAVVRGVVRVPPVRPAASSPAMAALEAPGRRVVGELTEQWLTRTGAERYLPDLMADAFRAATGADAALILPGYHGIQAPFDGAVASLGPGEVTELDLLRLCADPGYDPLVVELRPGELERALEAYRATADPANAAADQVAWNWCRMPAGTAGDVRRAAAVAVIGDVAGHLRQWLDRDVEARPSGVGAREALAAAIA
jgi:2',3'-cyclic-nucleotide 2'-phosphodiesterase (5'-nucleotidase family)